MCVCILRYGSHAIADTAPMYTEKKILKIIKKEPANDEQNVDFSFIECSARAHFLNVDIVRANGKNLYGKRLVLAIILLNYSHLQEFMFCNFLHCFIATAVTFTQAKVKMSGKLSAASP